MDDANAAQNPPERRGSDADSRPEDADPAIGDEPTCAVCGKPIRQDDIVCPHCGAPLVAG